MKPKISDEEFKKFINENPNLSDEEIGKKLGYSRFGVISKRQRLNIIKPKKILSFDERSKLHLGRFKVNLEEFKDFVIKNPTLSNIEIAENFSISVATVFNIRKKVGVTSLTFAQKKNIKHDQ